MQEVLAQDVRYRDKRLALAVAKLNKFARVSSVTIQQEGLKQDPVEFGEVYLNTKLQPRVKLEGGQVGRYIPNRVPTVEVNGEIIELVKQDGKFYLPDEPAPLQPLVTAKESKRRKPQVGERFVMGDHIVSLNRDGSCTYLEHYHARYPNAPI